MRDHLFCCACAFLLYESNNLRAQLDQPRTEVHVNPRDLAIEARRMGPPPLPYQPVRLRIIARNLSQSKIGPLLPMGHAIFFEKSVVKRDGANYEDTAWPARVREYSRGYSTNGEAAELWPGESLSISIAVTPISMRLGYAGPDYLEHCKSWGPGQHKLVLKYRAGYDQSGAATEVKAEMPFVISEPRGPDKKVAEVLAKDAKLAACIWHSWEPPAPELVPKLQDLLKFYPKRKELSGLTTANGAPELVEREICEDSSYAHYIHFALARHYLDRSDKQAWAVEGRTRAASELDHVVDRAFAYQPNALTLGLRQSSPPPFAPSIPRSAWAQSRFDQMRKLLLDHFSDTTEFLNQWYWVFFNEEVEWRPNRPAGSDENWWKLRKTIPRPYPPPGFAELAATNAALAAAEIPSHHPSAANLTQSEEPRGWRNVLIFAGLSVAILLALGALVYSTTRHRRNGGGA